MKSSGFKIISFVMFIFVFGSPLFCEDAFADLPQTDEEARACFHTMAREYPIILEMLNEPLTVDKVFWRVDANDNVYYQVSDTFSGACKIARFSKDGRADFFEPAGYEKHKIRHFDVSADGKFIFVELQEPLSRSGTVVCIDTDKPGECNPLIRMKGNINWINSSLAYSDANECLYFHVYQEPQFLNDIEVYYDLGFYVCQKTDGSFSDAGVRRYLNLADWMIGDARRAFTHSGKSDYTGFLDWIYCFADKGERLLCYRMDDGTLLTEEDALRYLIENNLFKDTPFFLKTLVCRVEDGQISGETAFSVDTGYPAGLPVTFVPVPSHLWFVKTDDGIWGFNEISMQYVTDSGEQAWKCDYMKAYWIEKKDGSVPMSSENPLAMQMILAPVDYGSSTAVSYKGALIARVKDGEQWLAYKDGNSRKFSTYEEAAEGVDKGLLSDKKVFGKSRSVNGAAWDVWKAGQNRALIIVILVLVLLVLAEGAVLIYIASDRFRRQLSKRDKRAVYNIQEAERTKLARDIHDSVVQNIRAIRLDAEMLEVKDGGEQKKQKIVDEITEVILLLRNICYNLHPAELSVKTNSTEFISVIDTLCQQFIVRSKIPCQIQIQKDFVQPELDDDTSISLVRVIQEALSNIEKHSYATNVQLLIRNEEIGGIKKLVIFIIDDGVGCDVAKAQKSKLHFGMRNMKERMAGMGGEIEFFSNQNEGMSVQLRVKV